MKKLINWKLFFILLIACIITIIMVLPYSFDLTSIDLIAVAIEQGIAIEILILLMIVQYLIMFAIIIFLGLLLSTKIGLETGGLRLPILEGILNKENKTKEFKAILLPSISLGVLAGVLIIIISIPFNNAIPVFKNMEVIVPAWKGFLASFYGGIAEEVLLRLFFMSFLVWVTFLIKKNKDGNPTSFGVWLSIILASVIFGIGHLPATAINRNNRSSYRPRNRFKRYRRYSFRMALLEKRP
ncbi:MAG: CPBP family glutamic-type intramembrane protease [Treponema sp.]|nr:CPBP family glutamic-type intramembrane protease [Treponema sp.]